MAVTGRARALPGALIWSFCRRARCSSGPFRSKVIGFRGRAEAGVSRVVPSSGSLAPGGGLRRAPASASLRVPPSPIHCIHCTQATLDRQEPTHRLLLFLGILLVLDEYRRIVPVLVCFRRGRDHDTPAFAVASIRQWCMTSTASGTIKLSRAQLDYVIAIGRMIEGPHPWCERSFVHARHDLRSHR